MEVKTRRIAVTVLSFIGLVLLARTSAAPALPLSASLTLDGQAIAGAPVSFSATAALNSSVRIVVVPVVLPEEVRAVPTAQFVAGCYFDTPTALGTVDATTDSSGNVGPIVVWAAATPGSYRALLLQGSCLTSRSGGRTTEAASDQMIVASQDFTVGDPTSIPALSTWGFAALGLALSVAGWIFLSRTRS